MSEPAASTRAPAFAALRRVGTAVRTATAVDAAAFALVAIGCVVRTAQYVSGRTLWLDESFLTLNLLDRSFADILGTLDFNQAAPPGFLLVERTMVSLLGSSVYSLRAFAFLCALVSVPLFDRLAKSVLPPPARLFALALFAAAPQAILYAGEVKQYEVELLVTILLLLVALPLLRQWSGSRLVALGALGVVSVWFAYGAVFILAAVACGLAVDTLLRSSYKRLVPLGVVAATWLVSFAALLRTSVEHAGGVRQSFDGRYMAIPPNLGWLFESAHRRVLGYFLATTGSVPRVAVIAAAFVLVGVGLVTLLRSSLPLAVVLATPWLLMLIASGLHRYPFGTRFVLFALPTVLIVMGAALLRLPAPSRARPLDALVAAAIGVLAVNVLLAVVARTVAPEERQEVHPALQTIQRLWQPGDVVALDRESQYSAAYYAAVDRINWSADGRRRLWPADRAEPSADEYAPALEPTLGRLYVGDGERRASARAALDAPAARRVWFVFSDLPWRADDIRGTLAWLDARARRIATYRWTRAKLVLYELPERNRLASHGLRFRPFAR